MNIGELIGQVMLNNMEPDEAIRKAGCKTVASQQMMCGCGQVLDQHTVVVVTVKTPIRRVIQGMCPECWKTCEKDILDAAKHTETPIQIESWDEEIFRQGNVE